MSLKYLLVFRYFCIVARYRRLWNFEEMPTSLRLSWEFCSTWQKSCFISWLFHLKSQMTPSIFWVGWFCYLLWWWIIEIKVDSASFKFSLISSCDLLFSYINILISNISIKCSRLEVLGIEGIITIILDIVEKCEKVKLVKIFICNLVYYTGQSLFRLDLHL